MRFTVLKPSTTIIKGTYIREGEQHALSLLTLSKLPHVPLTIFIYHTVDFRYVNRTPVLPATICYVTHVEGIFFNQNFKIATMALAVRLAVVWLALNLKTSFGFIPPSRSFLSFPINGAVTLLYNSEPSFSSEATRVEKKETTWDRITGPKLFKVCTTNNEFVE